jgi:hypothetical protein
MANSNTITYSFLWDADIAMAKLEAQAMGLDSYLNSALHNASYFVKEEMKNRAPEGVGGANGQGLKNTIGIKIDAVAKTAEIKPTVPYADAVETGSKPHMPPTDPDGSLAQWCEMKGLNLWAIAMSIKRKGTKPHPYIEPTYQAMIKPVSDIFDAQIAQYLNGI